MSKQFKISDEIIEKVLNFLRLTDPEHASRDSAVSILEFMQATQERMSFDNPEELDDIIQDWKKKNKRS